MVEKLTFLIGFGFFFILFLNVVKSLKLLLDDTTIYKTSIQIHRDKNHENVTRKFLI